MEAERWLPVVGFEGLYEVSDQGRVRSMARVVPHKKSGRLTVPERILKGGKNTASQYCMVSLWRNNAQHQCYRHSLVLEAFVGPRPPKHDACHADGTRDNNCVGNLRWGTRAENMQDAKRHGRTGNAASLAARWGHKRAEGVQHGV